MSGLAGLTGTILEEKVIGRLHCQPWVKAFAKILNKWKQGGRTHSYYHSCLIGNAKHIHFDDRKSDKKPAEQTGEVFRVYDNVRGFACVNKEQPDRRCDDYELRLCCPLEIGLDFSIFYR